MTAQASTWTDHQLAAAARAVMETRVRWGWTLGYKRPRVMAIDQLMARAALDTVITDG